MNDCTFGVIFVRLTPKSTAKKRHFNQKKSPMLMMMIITMVDFRPVFSACLSCLFFLAIFFLVDLFCPNCPTYYSLGDWVTIPVRIYPRFVYLIFLNLKLNFFFFITKMYIICLFVHVVVVCF